MSKPTPSTDILWADLASPGDITDPDASLRSNGYPENAPLPHNEFNAIHNRLGDYLNSVKRSVGVFSNITDAGNFLDEGDGAIIDSFDPSLGVGAPTHSGPNTYETNTTDTIIASNGVYIAYAEIDSSTADEVTLHVMEWDFTAVTSTTYTYSSHSVIALDWCGDRLIVTWLDGGGVVQYDVFDDPTSSLASADRTRTGPTGGGKPAATSVDRFYIATGGSYDNLTAVDPSDLSSYTFAGTAAFTGGTGYANGRHVVAPINGATIAAELLYDNGTSLVAQGRGPIDSKRDTEAQFRANDDFQLIAARDFDGTNHDLFVTLTQFTGEEDYGDRIIDGDRTNVDGYMKVDMSGRWTALLTPEDTGFTSRPIWLLRHTGTLSLPSFYTDGQGYASNDLAITGDPDGGPAPISELSEIQEIALTADALYLSGIPASGAPGTIYRLQLPGPVKVEKSESSTRLYLHDTSE